MNAKPKSAMTLLEELVHERDEKIAELQRKLEHYQEEEEEDSWRWARHHVFEDDPRPMLPLPRLELFYHPKYTDGNWYNYVVEYNLMYRHFDGNVIEVPLNSTEISGGGGLEQNTPPIHHFGPDNGKIRLPFRSGPDSVHDSAIFRMPVYAVCQNIINELTPTAKEALKHKQSAEERLERLRQYRQERDDATNE